MKRKTIYNEDMPSDGARIIKNFLPPPDKLVLPHDHVKVTLLLDRPSVSFFKTQAKRHGTKYQRMMREVLKHYAHVHAGHAA